MKQIDNMFEKFGDTLSPKFETEDKIWNVVSSKLSQDASTKISKLSNFNRIFFMKRVIKFSLAVFVVCFVIAVPVALTQGTKVLPMFTGASNESASTPSKDKNAIGITSGMTSTENYVYDETSNFAAKPTQTTTIDNSTLEKDRAKMYNAYLIYNVADVWAATDSVNKIIAEFDGYTTDVQVTSNGAHFTIKVPVAKFSSMQQRLREIASSIEEETINSVDQQNSVTEWNMTIKNYEDQLTGLKDKLSKSTNDSEKRDLQNQINSVTNLKTAAESNLAGILKTTDVSTIDLLLKKDGAASNFDLNDSLRLTLSKIQDVVVVWLNILLIAVVAMVAISPILVPAIILSNRSKKKKEAEVEPNN